MCPPHLLISQPKEFYYFPCQNIRSSCLFLCGAPVMNVSIIFYLWELGEALSGALSPPPTSPAATPALAATAHRRPPPMAPLPLASLPVTSPQTTPLSPDALPFHPDPTPHGRPKELRWQDGSPEEASASPPRSYREVATGASKVRLEFSRPPSPRSSEPERRLRPRGEAEQERRHQPREHQRHQPAQGNCKPKVRSIAISGTIPYQSQRRGAGPTHKPSAVRSGAPGETQKGAHSFLERRSRSAGRR